MISVLFVLFLHVIQPDCHIIVNEYNLPLRYNCDYTSHVACKCFANCRTNEYTSKRLVNVLTCVVVSSPPYLNACTLSWLSFLYSDMLHETVPVYSNSLCILTRPYIIPFHIKQIKKSLLITEIFIEKLINSLIRIKCRKITLDQKLQFNSDVMIKLL